VARTFEAERGEDIISDINVTPLVDVVLVLLIIFMVTATYIVRQAIEVTLPRAAQAGETTGTTLAVVLTRDGDVFLDGARVAEGELRAGVRAAAAKDPEARAVISADERALHGAVVRLIDVLKGEGVTRFAIHVERER
jgi:biopolymer transport protein ExbD